mmetsp:Transcript_13141/g.22413  ORF Transcript_13141/g.22413 Transcript_13141/m.22413 type:complete len:121 (-) Transcript_13141:258-620(-)
MRNQVQDGATTNAAKACLAGAAAFSPVILAKITVLRPACASRAAAAPVWQFLPRKEWLCSSMVWVLMRMMFVSFDATIVCKCWHAWLPSLTSVLILTEMMLLLESSMPSLILCSAAYPVA